MFSPLHEEVWISLIILYLSWHIGIAIHEMGHISPRQTYRPDKNSQENADAMGRQGFR